VGFSRAVRVGERVLVSGSAPIGPDGETVAGGVEAQARRCVAILVEAVEAFGGTAADVVRTRTYLTRREDWELAARVHGEAFAEARPAATMVVVPSLLDPAWLLEMEAEACLGEVAGEGCEVRPTTDADRAWIAERSQEIFNGVVVISRGVAHRPADLPGFVAWRGGERVGLATYLPEGKVCELVTIDALVEQQGVGTALLAAVEGAAREAGCRALWLVTTNDNLGALRFYQRRGFALAELHVGALERSRELKPAIPRVGDFGIPMNDELLLEKGL